MPSPNLILLYVTNPQASAEFYSRLLACAPVAMHPTYAAFALKSGLNIGLWSISAKNFVSGGSGHRGEIAFMVPNDEEVRSLHTQWTATAVEIEQPLHEAVFGLTFVALDPDGHRIRVCTPDP